MATKKWRFTVFPRPGQGGGVQEIEVNGSNYFQAKENAERITGGSAGSYEEIKEDPPSKSSLTSNSGSSMSWSDIGGYGSLLALLVLIWVFISFMPWFTMLAGGALGGWLSGKILGTNLEEAIENDKGKLVAIIALTAFLSGGLGFVKGYDWREWFNAQTEIETTTPTTKKEEQPLRDDIDGSDQSKVEKGISTPEKEEQPLRDEVDRPDQSETKTTISTLEKEEQPLQENIAQPYWIYLGMTDKRETGSSLIGTVTTTLGVVPDADIEPILATTTEVVIWPYSTASRGEPKGKLKKGTTLKVCKLALNQLDNKQYAAWAEVAPEAESCNN